MNNYTTFSHKTGTLVSSGDAEILVIRGDNDFLTNLESMARLKGMNAKVNFMNVPFSEHVVFDESPDIVLGAIGKFFGFEMK